eukprot:363475-Chlamydomonas_euryale.AAC.3
MVEGQNLALKPDSRSLCRLHSRLLASPAAQGCTHVAYVLNAQVKRCGCRRWCCGTRNTAFASHGVDFTQWIGHLRNKCVPRRTNALMSVFSGMNLMCTCAKKASKGRHKDTIPCRWREDEEEQQVEEEGEELPDQGKQPVLEEGAVAAA